MSKRGKEQIAQGEDRDTICDLLQQAMEIAERRLRYPLHIRMTISAGAEMAFVVRAKDAEPKMQGEPQSIGEIVLLLGTAGKEDQCYPLTLVIRELDEATGKLGDWAVTVPVERDWIQ